MTELIGRMMDGSISYEAAVDHARSLFSSAPPIRQNDKIRHLQNVPMLRECSPRQLRAVAKITRIIEGSAGIVLAREGQAGNHFFIILDGSMTVRVPTGNRFTLAPGDYFGEMSLLDGEPRSATVEAHTDVRVLVIERRHFWALLRETPGLTQTILRTLSRRVRQLEKPPLNL
jgi:CRP-like cAMP-binding protein